MNRGIILRTLKSLTQFKKYGVCICDSVESLVDSTCNKRHHPLLTPALIDNYGRMLENGVLSKRFQSVVCEVLCEPYLLLRVCIHCVDKSL